MKNLLSSFVGACALASSFAAFACNSAPQAQMSEAEMMAKWTEYATPGEAHKVLDYKVGRWNLKVRMYMAPDAPPSESTGTSVMKWIMDGRYMQDETTGSANGMPFSGHGIAGYDNLTKRYVSVWIDNMGTGVLRSEGTYDAKHKTFTFTSQQPDFAAGEYTEVRTVDEKIDDDHFVVRVFGPDPSGKEFKSMELEYTRAR